MTLYADVFWVLKIYVSEALARFARSRNKSTYIIFVGTFGGLAPPPPQYQKAGYASVKHPMHNKLGFFPTATVTSSVHYPGSSENVTPLELQDGLTGGTFIPTI